MSDINKNKLLRGSLGVLAFQASLSFLNATYTYKNCKEYHRTHASGGFMEHPEKKRKLEEKNFRKEMERRRWETDPNLQDERAELERKREADKRNGRRKEGWTNKGNKVLNRFMEAMGQGISLEELEKTLGCSLKDLSFLYAHIYRNDELTGKGEKLSYNLLREAILIKRWDVVEFIISLDHRIYRCCINEKYTDEKEICEKFFLHSARMGDAPVFFCLLNRGVDIHCKNSLILWDGGYRSGNVRDFYEYGISTDGDNNFSNNGEGYLQIGKFLDDMSDGLEEAAW